MNGRKNKVIAVTGSAGFVGSGLVRKLKEDNYKVLELDFSTGYDLNLMDTLENVDKFDILIHLAAKTSVPDSFLRPDEFYKNNINTTLNSLELCRRFDSKIIFASSYVYGKPVYLPIDENHPTDHFNPYASSKIICENLCGNYQRFYNVPSLVLRVFNIYGKGQNQGFLIGKILEQAKTGSIILEDPEPKRDFIHIDDVINAYLHAIIYQGSDFEIYNIASGKSYSVREVVSIIGEVSGKKLDIFFNGKRRENEVMDTIADISKAKKMLNWKPERVFRDALAEMLSEG